MNILVPNLGSTSLKYQLLDMADERVIARGKIERIGSADAVVSASDASAPATQVTRPVADHRAAVQTLIEHLDGAGHRSIDAVGFKAVIGGPDYRGSFRVDAPLLAAMREYPAGGARAQRRLHHGHGGLSRRAARRADGGRLRAGISCHHAGSRGRLRRAVRVVRAARRPPLRLSWLLASLRRRPDARPGRPSRDGPAHRVVSSRRQFVDLRHPVRRVGGLQLRVLAADRASTMRRGQANSIRLPSSS